MVCLSRSSHGTCGVYFRNIVATDFGWTENSLFETKHEVHVDKSKCQPYLLEEVGMEVHGYIIG